MDESVLHGCLTSAVSRMMKTDTKIDALDLLYPFIKSIHICDCLFVATAVLKRVILAH